MGPIGITQVSDTRLIRINNIETVYISNTKTKKSLRVILESHK